MIKQTVLVTILLYQNEKKKFLPMNILICKTELQKYWIWTKNVFLFKCIILSFIYCISTLLHNLDHLIFFLFLFTRHIMFAPSQFDAYVDNSFPGIVDTMVEIEKGLDKWDQLKQQVYITTYTIQSAASSLGDVGL